VVVGDVMMLPTPGPGPDHALLTLGAQILQLLREPATVSRLWDQMRAAAEPCPPFERFVLAMDLLYMLGLVDMANGRVVRRELAHPEPAAI
jgi:hypothetical protein